MLSDTYLAVGFEILKAQQDTKHKFDAGGRDTQIGFVQACIKAGLVWDHLIVNLAVRITGEHIRNEISFLIEEGENEYWYRNECSELGV